MQKYNFPYKELNFIGLISLMDPPQTFAPETILKLRAAGIKVMMVTGD